MEVLKESAEEMAQRLEREIKQLKREQAKAEKNSKKGNLKEAALKADVAKMKAEVRQLKKEADQARQECAREVSALKEETARHAMFQEEQLLRNATASAKAFSSILTAVAARDPGLIGDLSAVLTSLEVRAIGQPAVDTVTFVKSSHDELTAKVSALDKELARMKVSLESEKERRQEDNDRWRAVVEDLEEKEASLSYNIEQLHEEIEELNTQLEEEKSNFELELARQREEDQNTVS